MVLPALSGSDVTLLVVYVLVLWGPGLVVGALAGGRGWSLAAGAPVLSYGIAGLLGPWSSGFGLRWSPWSFLGCVATVAVLVGALRWAIRAARPPSPGSWAGPGSAAVAACVVVASVTGVVTVLVGMGGLRTIPQDWDAAFHANGIRFIIESGDAGLRAMTAPNWYELPGGFYYPNAYHLLATTVAEMTGRDIPSVLNAQTSLLPGVLALGLAALVHRFGGRAVLGGSSALLVVAASPFYDMLWRGPLLPYATGVALVPATIVATMDLLERDGLRSRLLPAAVLLLALAGMLCLNPAVLVTVVLFAAPAVAARWVRDRRTARTDLLVLLTAGVVTLGVCVAPVLGSLGSVVGPSVDWPADLSQSDAVGQLLLFGHPSAFPQWWLVLPLVIGLVRFPRLGRLRWLGASAAIFSVLFVAAASFDTPWAEAITRPWWNDRYRLVGVVVAPLAVIAAHGVSEASRGLVLLADRLPGGRFRRRPRGTLVARAGAAAATLLVLGAASGGFYLGRNENRMSRNTGDGPAVSSGEVAGYAALARMVPPQDRVMNDRGDGSVWMYALDGVHPVAAHYDATATGPDAVLLAERFDRYDTDPQVRAAATRLGVRWVAVGRGFLRDYATREPGLVELDRVRALRLVWANPDFRIYQLTPPG